MTAGYPQTTFQNVRFSPDSFWGKKRAAISSEALRYQLGVLKKTGRYDAFRLKWHPIYDDEPEIWPVPKHLFWDSDVAKWIEGACYFLQSQDDTGIRENVDELVSMIASAQQPDGYINIHFTVVAPGKRFTNLRDLHELYNAGHLIEAALAHAQLYSNNKLLDPVIKYVDLLADTFGAPPKRPGYPGHPEIELALLRLYERTKSQKHLELAQFFLTERGNPKGMNGKHFYDEEAERRGETSHEIPDYFPAPRSYWYQQAHEPITQQPTIEGHSVRAMYLLTAVADLVRIQGSKLDTSYRKSLFRLWDNMVSKKMYVTGGIGSVKKWEGFGPDYSLPDSTDEGGCYAETCASIGVMMLADRILEIDRDSQYADIMELELYNAVLTGVSCNGRDWTYVNQLASSDTDLSERSSWFTVACCPPNVLRLLGNLGGYLYSSKTDQDGSEAEITINMFADATITHTSNGKEQSIRMKTAYPLDGKVHLEVVGSGNTSLWVRIPGWATHHWNISPKPESTELTKGYLRLDAAYVKAHPKFELDLPMKPRLISPHPYTGHQTAAVARGPIVYCAEDADNTWVTDHFKNTIFNTNASLSESTTRDSTTNEDVCFIKADKAGSQLDLARLQADGPGHTFTKREDVKSSEAHDLVFVPYYFRANRHGTGHMRVCLQTDN